MQEYSEGINVGVEGVWKLEIDVEGIYRSKG